MRVARILVITGLERERGMHQIQIDGVEPESVQAGLQRGPDPFGSMVVVPQLCGHKQGAAATSASLRYRSAASRWRKPTSTAVLTAFRVFLLSESEVPNPSAGISPL